MEARNVELRRLMAWNAFWRTLLVVTAVVAWIGWMVQRNTAASQRLHCSRAADGSLILEAHDGGPYLITHLVTAGENDPEKVTAVLYEPLAIVDPDGASIPVATLKKLKWRSTIDGERVPYPSQHPLTALYVRPGRAIIE